MKFPGQGLRTLETEQRHKDGCDWNYYHVAFAGDKTLHARCTCVLKPVSFVHTTPDAGSDCRATSPQALHEIVKAVVADWRRQRLQEQLANWRWWPLLADRKHFNSGLEKDASQSEGCPSIYWPQCARTYPDDSAAMSRADVGRTGCRLPGNSGFGNMEALGRI